MHTVISVHPLLFGQGLIKAFLSLLKGLLQQERGTTESQAELGLLLYN